MKKLYFLVPITLWVLALPIWNFASQFIESIPTTNGIWWFITCGLWGAFSLMSLLWAMEKQP